MWRWTCKALNSAADLRLGLPAVSTWMRPVPADAGLPRTEPDSSFHTPREPRVSACAAHGNTAEGRRPEA